MSLKRTLQELSERHTAELSARDRADVEDQLDRLRMMRVAEDGLGLGDHLPDFELSDGQGRLWNSSALLDGGPLVLALFRGDWCPYCDLTMVALEEARPAIETLGAHVAGILPGHREHVAEIAKRRGLAYPLLCDPANAYARTCGLTYELSPGYIRIHRERGRNFPALHGDSEWRLPVPAVFVVQPNARIVFAFADADPARWPDPEELVTSLVALRDAHRLSNR